MFLKPTKPNLLVKAVNAWVRSAFANVYFGHFPIEIPIEAEKIYQHGKELS